MIPIRIQLRRTKGWRKPEGVIVVARPSRCLEGSRCQHVIIGPGRSCDGDPATHWRERL